MFLRMPYKEQESCERKLVKVMDRLNIEEFTFNYDRTSCYIEFKYEGQSYKLEHSIQRATEKGIVRLRNGLDCLIELVQSLEDLYQITSRGTYRLEQWMSGMKQQPTPTTASNAEDDLSEFLEEVHIRYKSLTKQQPDYNREEDFLHVGSDASLEDFENSPILRRSQNK